MQNFFQSFLFFFFQKKSIFLNLVFPNFKAKKDFSLPKKNFA